MGSGAMILVHIPSFITIGSGIGNSLRVTQKHADRKDGDDIRLV
jgi:hypothetical protein